MIVKLGPGLFPYDVTNDYQFIANRSVTFSRYLVLKMSTKVFLRPRSFVVSVRLDSSSCFCVMRGFLLNLATFAKTFSASPSLSCAR